MNASAVSFNTKIKDFRGPVQRSQKHGILPLQANYNVCINTTTFPDTPLPSLLLNFRYLCKAKKAPHF